MTLGALQSVDSPRSSLGEGTPRAPLLAKLDEACRAVGVDGAAHEQLFATLEADVASVEGLFSETFPREPTALHRSAAHLLETTGKRLRPLCAFLGAQFGAGPHAPAVRSVAAAAELVHSATLLHDDVVDVGDVRRGAPAARVLYGNAASVYGGDWLLVEALRRVQSAGFPDVLDAALAVLRQMLDAEALQLERRGTLSLSEAEYFSIARGKTASLFSWAFFAGARAAGADRPVAEALGAFGGELGLAFQLVDDLLDVSGDEAVTGKAALKDLEEGKLTYPVLVAMSRDAGFQRGLTAWLAEGSSCPFTPREMRALLETTGALRDTQRLIDDTTTLALATLHRTPRTPARDLLAALAVSLGRRSF